jgi:hypothetical protein
MGGYFEAFETVAGLGEALLFFVGGFDDFELGELGFGGADSAAVGAGEDEDDLAEATAGMARGKFGGGFKGFEEG